MQTVELDYVGMSQMDIDTLLQINPQYGHTGHVFTL